MDQTLDLDALKARYGAPALDLDGLKARYGTPASLPMMAPDAPLPPSQFTLDIAKPSAAGPEPDGPVPALAPASLQWLPGFEFMHALPQAAQDKVAQAVPGLVATALTTGGTMAGAAVGGMTGPAAPVAVPVLSAVGGEAGNITSKWLGAQPGQWNEPDLSDALAVGVPLVAGGGTAIARAALPYTRAGRAVQTATNATAAKNAEHAGWLAQAEAEHAETVAAARGRLAADGSLPPVTPVPPELERLRSTPPTPVEPTLPPPTLSSLTRHYFGYVPSWAAPVVAPVDTVDAVVSHALKSPTLRPWLMQQLEASGGTLTPQTLATLSTVVRGGMPADGASEAPR